MGAATARISSADFVIPSELAGLQLASRSAGQVGGLRFELVAAEGKTRLGDCYQQMPLRLLPPFSFPGEPAALVYLLNPTVGLLDGDGQLVEILARTGTRALVTGQSANRIHPAVEGFATQQWHIRVEEDAQLVLLPGPTIPFRGCRYYQRAIIDLAPGASLIWGDVWFPGRYARGSLSEQYQFDWLIQHLEIHRRGHHSAAGALIFRDRFAWQGPWDGETMRWHAGTGLATGILFLTGIVEQSAVARHGCGAGHRSSPGLCRPTAGVRGYLHPLVWPTWRGGPGTGPDGTLAGRRLAAPARHGPFAETLVSGVGPPGTNTLVLPAVGSDKVTG